MHAGTFVVQVLPDCLGESVVGEPMCGQGPCRQEAASDFVLTLRTGLEAREAMSDTVFLALVIAGLEVQHVEVL